MIGIYEHQISFIDLKGILKIWEHLQLLLAMSSHEILIIAMRFEFIIKND